QATIDGDGSDRSGRRSLRGIVSGALYRLEKRDLDDREILAARPPVFATLQGKLLARASGHLLEHLADDELADAPQLRRAVECFGAMELTLFISYVFAILKNRALSCTLAIACLMLAVASFPMQPQHRLVSLTLFGVLATGAAILWTLIEIERDP